MKQLSSYLSENMDLKLLGNICKEFRVESGIPVKEIADKCGYTPANVYKFERGESNNAIILLAYLWYGLDLDPREPWIDPTTCKPFIV